MFRSASRGNLKGAELKTQSGSAVSVALTSEGYPGSYEKGKVIYGLDKEYDGVKVFHSGTKRNENGEIVTNGGRVVFVTGQGGDVYEARKSAYSAIGETDVHFEDMEYRSDIGVRIR
jgi:phosphoribosylamine--glycine ligase